MGKCSNTFSIRICVYLLRAIEDTFELHLVQLEAVERQIHKLLGKQVQLRERRLKLETSRADTHKSGVSMQPAANTPTTSTPCVFLHRPRAPGMRSSQMFFTPAPGNHRPWMQQRKKQSRPRTMIPPPSSPRDLHPLGMQGLYHGFTVITIIMHLLISQHIIT